MQAATVQLTDCVANCMQAGRLTALERMSGPAAYLAVLVQAFEWLMFGSCAIVVLAAVVFTVYARAALARHTPRQLLGGWVSKPG